MLGATGHWVSAEVSWIPAFAGKTGREVGSRLRGNDEARWVSVYAGTTELLLGARFRGNDEGGYARLVVDFRRPDREEEAGRGADATDVALCHDPFDLLSADAPSHIGGVDP